MRATVIGKLLVCVAALLSCATVSQAATFSFSYSGIGIPSSVTASGTITATQIMPGIYQITNLTGTQNGYAMTLGSGTTFVYSGSSSTGTLNFKAQGGTDIVSFAGPIFSETGAIGMDTGSNFKLTATPVPEAASLLILISAGLGVCFFGRKLPSKRQSKL